MADRRLLVLFIQNERDRERERGRKSRPFSRLGIGEEIYIFVGFVLDLFFV